MTVTGYTCYTVVLPASDRIIEAQQAIWRRYPSPRAAIPAHVTVKGTCVGIASLDHVKSLIGEISAVTAPFRVSFEGADSLWNDTGGVMRIPVFPEIQALHDRLSSAISPLSGSRYRDEPYRVHMSLTARCAPDELAQVKDAFEEFDTGGGFDAEDVDLMGRVGRAEGGEWRRIERFPLTTGSPA
ncbi:MAG: 2'-5' RNA ligase family protein [Chloroflexi bacterium]|nr:2'-5' RNA ligase family protein [Chloroflexota bacterium]